MFDHPTDRHPIPSGGGKKPLEKSDLLDPTY